jgi:hypothetical protein
MSFWNSVRELEFLRLISFYPPIGTEAESNTLRVQEELNEKFKPLHVSVDDIKTLLLEYYELEELEKKFSTNAIANDDAKEGDRSEVQNESVEETNDGSTDAKRLTKHVIIDEDKNKVFGVNDEDKCVATDKTENTVKNDEEKAEISKEIDSADRDQNDHKLQDDTARKDEKESDEKRICPVVNEGEEEEGESEREGEEKEENDDEPAHLTRAQARKLHIDVLKETEQNEKKAHDIEGSRRKSVSRGTSDGELSSKRASPAKVDEESDGESEKNTSIAVESDDGLTIPKKRGRRSTKTEDATPRRSGRLTRKSNDVDSTEEGDKTTSTRRTRSISNTRMIHLSQSEAEHEETEAKTAEPARRGRRRKSSAAPADAEAGLVPADDSVSKTTRRTRSKGRFSEVEGATEEGDKDNDADVDEAENKNDDGLESASEEEGTAEVEMKADDNEKRESKPEGSTDRGPKEGDGEKVEEEAEELDEKEEEIEEEKEQDEEQDEDEDEDEDEEEEENEANTSRLRRSSRKRAAAPTLDALDTTRPSKKAKVSTVTATSTPEPASSVATPAQTPKRRGRKPKEVKESKEANETTPEDANETTESIEQGVSTRRSRRRTNV